MRVRRGWGKGKSQNTKKRKDKYRDYDILSGSMNQVNDIIQQLKKRNPEAIVLFGSHAWGTPHKDSDVDVLLVEKTDKSFSDRVRDVHRMLRGSIPVDVIVLNPEEAKKVVLTSSFYQNIFSEGKVVYGRI